jgi:pentatricopeptide repeat protein
MRSSFLFLRIGRGGRPTALTFRFPAVLKANQRVNCSSNRAFQIPDELLRGSVQSVAVPKGASFRYEGFSYAQKQLASATATARHLLDESSYPLGSFSLEVYQAAKDVLEEFLKWRDATDAEAVNASLDLLERLVKEMAFVKDDKQSKWLCNPRFFNSLFNRWKEAALHNVQIISASDLVKKLKTMSTQLPEFRYNIETINMIMHVAIKQAHPSKAPCVAESLLELVKTEATHMNNSDLMPTVYSYNMILNAWAESKLPEASPRMDAILKEMRNQQLAADIVSYNILLRFWNGMGEVNKVDAILRTMKHDGVKPNLTNWSVALSCYAKVGQTRKAEEILQRMIDEHTPGYHHDDNALGQSVQNIMSAYLRVVTTNAFGDKRKKRALDCAEVLVQKMQRTGVLAADTYGTSFRRLRRRSWY